MSTWQRFGNVFKKPAKAFWDLRHSENRGGSFLVILASAILMGLLGLAVVSHIEIKSWGGEIPT